MVKDYDRTNFVRRYKLYAACLKDKEDISTDNMRQYVYFLNGYAYATNGAILVRVPLDLCTTFQPSDIIKFNGFRIHYSVLKLLTQSFDNIRVVEDFEVFDDNGKLLNEDGDPERRLHLISERKGNRIIVILKPAKEVPNFESILELDQDRQPIMSLGVRVKYLGDIADAIGCSSIKMRFTQANNKVYVEEIDRDPGMPYGLGVIMPIIVNPSLPGFDD